MIFFVVKLFNSMNLINFSFYFEFQTCFGGIFIGKIFAFRTTNNQKISKTLLLNILPVLISIN